MVIIRYDRLTYPFPTLVQRYFDRPLDRLHDEPDPEPAHDQATRWHARVYSRLDGVFFDTYLRFMRHLATYLEPLDWVVQAVPTFRFQIPGRTGTTEFHRDSAYGHPPETLNVIVPLTNMHGSAAVVAQTVPYAGEYKPMIADVGEAILFHGALCRHGTYPNREGYTRVSFDARLLPRAALPTDERTTHNRKVPLALGAYYRELR